MTITDPEGAMKDTTRMIMREGDSMGSPELHERRAERFDIRPEWSY
jgi:hypothetical protein